MGRDNSIQLLGTPRATADGNSTVLPPKHTALLALLADSHPRAVPRTQLVEYLWPGADISSGRHSLSQALYRLRKKFGPRVIDSSDDQLALGKVRCDLLDFRQAITVGDWSEAASLYRGRFLEGFHLEECIEFDHWLDRTRSNYEGEAAKILAHPLPESVAKPLAAVLPKADPTIYEEPTASTFVGRTGELENLYDAWRRSSEGRLTIAVVSGPPGIGKTALCERALKRAVINGALPFVVEGAAAERNLPLGAVGKLLDQMVDRGLLEWAEEPWRSVLGGVHERLATGSKDPEPGTSGAGDFRLAAALTHLLGRTADSQPVVILVDDAHWVDEASVSVIHYACRANLDHAVMFMLAVRSGDDARDFWRQWPAATVLELGGLTQSETEALVRKITPASTQVTGDGDAIYGLSRGNPLLIHALLGRNHRNEGILGSDAKEYFSNQLSTLTGPARQVGAAIAVVGSSVDEHRLSWLTEFNDAQAGAAIEELLEAGYIVLDQRTGHFAFKHHLIADVFLESLSPISRARLHRRAGMLLQDEGSPAAVVATQFAIAGSKREACQAALAAAHGSLALFAYTEAEHFFRIAVAHSTNPDIEVQARCGLADLLLQLGRTREALAVTEGVGSTGAQRSSYPEIEAYSIIASVGHPTTPARLEDAAKKAQNIAPKLSPQLAGRLLFRIGRSAYQSGSVGLALASVRKSLQHLERASNGPVEAKYEVLALACEALWGGEYKNDRRLSEIIEQSRAHPSTYVSGLLARASVNHTQGRAATAECDLTTALESCERYGLLVQKITVVCNLAVAQMEQGEWEQAIEHTRSIINDPIASIIAPHEVANAMANRQIICFESGEFEAAVEWGDRILTGFSERAASSQTQINALGVKGLSQLSLGRLSSARESESQLWPLLDHGREWSHDVSYVEVFLARMLVVSGSEPEAVARLRHQAEAFANRDVYCAARMEVELLRISTRTEPQEVLARADTLRRRLLYARAKPLVDHLDRVIAKAESAVKAS